MINTAVNSTLNIEYCSISYLHYRFSPECKEGRHPLCYLPFGYGQRSCIGMRFALMEIKMALTVVLRDFKFEISNDTQVRKQQLVINTCLLLIVYIILIIDSAKIEARYYAIPCQWCSPQSH